MEFRKYAARETSETVARLVTAASDKVAGDLQALRQAFDMVTGALDAALATQANPDCAEDVAALAERLAAEADRHAEAAGEQARKDAQAALDELRAARQSQADEQTRLIASLEEARARVEDLKSELETRNSETEASRAACAKAEDACKHAEAARQDIESKLEKARHERDAITDELSDVRRQLQSAHADTAKLSAQRDAEAAQSEKVTAALSTVTTELQEAKAQIKKLLAEAKTAGTELQAARRDSDDLERAGKALQAKLDKADAAGAALHQRAEKAEADIARVRAEADASAKAGVQAARALEEAEARAGRLLAEQADTIRKHAAGFVELSLDRLLEMYIRNAKGATIEEVLASVVNALAAQFSRVALFRVQGNRLEGVHQAGFDVQGDISQVLIPRTLDSLVTQAVTSANIETRAGRELRETNGLPFGGTPEFGLALPIVIDGECLAVVYADDADQADRQFAKPDLREKFARLLQCQAAPLLARLMAEAKVLAELDEYAGLLLKELEQTHAEEAAAKTPDADRRKNLRENIEYARRMYAQRAASEGPRAAALFERRLFAAIEADGDTPFGRDVVAVVGGRKRPARAACAAGEAAGRSAS